MHSISFDNSEMTAHGFRTLASSPLNEKVFEGGRTFRPDAIERQLAHVETNKVRSAYSQADYFNERVEMMQVWADYLDSLIKN